MFTKDAKDDGSSMEQISFLLEEQEKIYKKQFKNEVGNDIDIDSVENISNINDLIENNTIYFSEFKDDHGHSKIKLTWKEKKDVKNIILPRHDVIDHIDKNNKTIKIKPIDNLALTIRNNHPSANPPSDKSVKIDRAQLICKENTLHLHPGLPKSKIDRIIMKFDKLQFCKEALNIQKSTETARQKKTNIENLVKKYPHARDGSFGGLFSKTNKLYKKMISNLNSEMKKETSISKSQKQNKV